MKHPYIDDEHVVDRYLAGDLPDDEVEAFEAHLFECEACLEAVEWGDELRRSVRSVTSPEVEADADDDSDASDLPAEILAVSKPWLASSAGRTVFASLALLLVALGVVALRQSAEIDRLRRVPAEVSPDASPDAVAGFTEPTADFQVASLGVVRSDEIAEIQLDANRSVLLLSLELPRVMSSGYHVELLDADGERVWQGENLKPTLYDSLLVAIPRSFLEPGEYSLLIETRSDAQPVGEIRFRIESNAR